MFRKSGFTLAEVLITLGIIGVVAAMTIPTLLNQTNDAEYKTALKKAISALNQAITMNVALDGTDFSALDVTGTATTANSVYTMFTKRLNVVSTGRNATINGKFNVATNYTLFLNDGIGVTFPKTAASCTTTSADCTIVIDVNGTKRPNSLSYATTTTGTIRDEFTLYFYNQQVVPADDSTRYVLFN